MAYVRPSNLDGFVPLLTKPDLRTRQLIGDDLISFLADSHNSLECDDMGLFVDNLLPWISGGNFKVSQNGLEILSSLINRMGSDFGTYAPSVLPIVIDRLGDSKEGVRLAARTVLANMWSNGSIHASQLIAKLSAAFQHKNANMREEALHCLADAINDQDCQDIQFKTLTPLVSRLLMDPNANVRDQAINTLVEMYRHAGDRLRTDLRSQKIPANKLTALEQKFDEIQAAGMLFPTATIKAALSAANSTDEIDNLALSKPMKPVKRTLSIPQKKIEGVSSSNGFESRRATTAVTSSGAQSMGSLHSLHSAQMRPPKNPAVDPGAVTMDTFEQQFLKVPQVALYSARDLDDICRLAMSVVGDKAADWEKRIEALKKIRALLISNAHSLYPAEFTAQLKEMSVPFLVVIKELRSQVVREACITIAYMAKVLKNKLDQFSLYVINELINLIPNSAKIMSSSGTLAIRFMVRYVHSPRFIPIITQGMTTSKAKEIRATLSDILCVILETWLTPTLEKQMNSIKEAIKKGCSDADMTARSHCRRAYWLFKKHFPVVAEALFITFENSVQKILTSERDGSVGTGVGSRHGSTDSLHQASAYTTSSARPTTERRMLSSRTASSSVTDRGFGYQSVGARSVSAVDTGAAARAKARLYSQHVSSIAARSRPVAGYTASLPRSKKTPVMSSQLSNPRSPESNAATRSRSRVSQSQPSSRSSSPSSRLPTPSSISSIRPTRRSSNSRIPRSLAGSRETSPIRTTATKAGLARTIGSVNRRLSSERPPAVRVPLTAQRLLAQSRGAENCLSPDDSNGADISAEMARLRLGRDMDNESEGSSICSERSYESYRLRMDSVSLSGSQSYLCGRNDGPVEITMTIPEMIVRCASTAWIERKEGLTQLIETLFQGQILTPHELVQVTEVFTRLFMDTHTKVYGLFLDAVCELVIGHNKHLHSWLYTLLTRLLIKLGSDLLGSIQGKVVRVLGVIQEYFPSEMQMYSVFRYLADINYKPNAKTKLATLNFATQVMTTYWQAPQVPIVNIIPSYIHTGARALNQVVIMAMDNRQSELKIAARRMLAALFSCDAHNMTLMMSELPKDVEQSAMAIVQSYIRRTSSSGSPGLVSSSPTTAEDVYRSLKRTTAEIQSFTHGADSEADNSRHDFNNRHNGINGHHSLDMSDHKTMSADSSEAGSTKDSSPTPQNLPHSRGLSGEDQDRAGSRDKSKPHEFDPDGFIITREGVHEQQAIDSFVTLVNSAEDETAVINSMVSLHEVIKYGNCQKPLAEFKNLMRVLIKLMERPEERIVAGCVRILLQMYKRDELKQIWLTFFDLIMIRFAEKFGIQKKEVTRILENGLPFLAKELPIEMSMPFIMPIMKASEYPSKLFALKLTTEIARAHPAQITDAHLDLLMSGISILAEHEHSSMRKAAIFCMVQLQLAVGEPRMIPYHTHLSASKIRLLKVYLNKEQGDSPMVVKRHGETKV